MIPRIRQNHLTFTSRPVCEPIDGVSIRDGQGSKMRSDVLRTVGEGHWWSMGDTREDMGAPVDVKDLSGDGRAHVREEKERRVGDFFLGDVPP